METCKISAGAFIAKGIVANTGAPAAVLEMREVQAAASTVGLATTTFKIRQTNDISTAIDALKDRAEALYGVSDPLVATNRNRLGILAVGAQLPRCMVPASMLKRAVLYPMEQTFRRCSGAAPSMSTRFCVGRSLPTSRWVFGKKKVSKLKLVIGGRATAAIANPSRRDGRGAEGEHGQVLLLGSTRRHLWHFELPNANNDVSCGTECISVIFSAAETAVVAVTVSKSAANDSNLDIETSGFGEA